MAADVPTKEPLEFRAGDSVAWSKTLADYSAAEYTLTYRARGAGSFDITCTADGTDFLAELTTAQTAALPDGDYWIIGTVSNGTDVKTIYAANIRILPNFETLTAGHDGRSHALKVRDSLRAMMEGTAIDPVMAYTIFGERNVQLVPMADRIKALAHYESLVRQEENQAAIDSGDIGAGKIYMRFTRPR